MGGKKSAPRRSAEAANKGVELQIEELRRQFDLSREDINAQRAQFDPFIQAGVGQLGALEEGASVEGLDARLGRILNSDVFGNLTDIRSRGVQGALGSAGLTRSGTAIDELSAVPQDVALGIEQTLTGRSQGLAASGQNAVAGQGGLAQFLASLGGQASGAIGGALEQFGLNKAGGITGTANVKTAALNQLISVGSNIASAFISDPRLKKNIEPVGEIIDLTIHEWDWIEEVEDSFVSKTPTTGFLADEVHKKYPEHSIEFGGFRGIDYGTLLPALEAKQKKIFERDMVAATIEESEMRSAWQSNTISA